MKVLKTSLLAATAIVVTSALPLASASTLLIDRGLPTANLNNAAGANRSNVSWAYGSYPATSQYAGDWLVGDSFTNTSADTYFIDTIRVWTTGNTSNADLLGGLAGASVFQSVSTTYAMTAVDYVNGFDYQVPSNAYTPLYQLDFSVGLTLGAGQTFNFFLNGDRDTSPFIPFLHASNAALSGSTQEGSDNTMFYAHLELGETTIPVANVGTWQSQGDGWDKNSDINVQVFGTVPDTGTTALMLGGAVMLMGVARRRQPGAAKRR